MDESDNPLRTVNYIVQDGTNFTIAPRIGGYKVKANPNVTVSSADVVVKVTYEEVLLPSANKGYKLKMKGTDLYVKFRISDYSEDAAVNATILSSEGSVFKIGTNEEGYTLMWRNEYMKTKGSYYWNSGHGADTANSTWYIEPVDGEDGTYYIKSANPTYAGSEFLGNNNDTPAADQYLYTNQTSSNLNIKWVIEETTMNDRMVEQGYWPETSTAGSPICYTIKNTRCGKYAKYAGDAEKMALETNRLESKANAFWFEAVDADVADDVLAVKIHNVAADKCVAATNSFTDDGIIWYLKADVYTGTPSIAINSNATIWDNNSYGWNNESNGGQNIAPYRSTDIGSAWWVDALTDEDLENMENYYTRVVANIQPFIDNAGDGYFKVSTADASTLTAIITAANSDGKISSEEYEALLEALDGYIRRPATGFYLLKSYYNGYMFNETGVVKANKTAAEVSTIVRLERQGIKNYKIAIQGSYLGTPTQGADVPLVAEGATFEVVTTTSTIGKVAFNSGASSYASLHTSESQEYRVVGWTVDAGASQWTVEDVSTVDIPLTAAKDNTSAAHTYATLCVPFEVTNLVGADSKEVKAYAPTKSGSYIVPGTGAATITEGAPVMLIGEEGATSVTATIGSGYATSPATSNVLTGTFTGTTIDCTADTGTNYVLGFDSENDNRIGFYHVNDASFALKANRAYLSTAGGGSVKGFAINWDLADGIEAVDSSELTVDSKEIYNLAGQRVDNSQFTIHNSQLKRGIYIVNGKKVLVK